MKKRTVLKRARLAPYSGYRTFLKEDIYWSEDADDTKYVDRAYLPWAKDHYGDWMAEYQLMPLGGTSNETVNAFLDRAGWGYQHQDEKRDALISAEMKKPIARISEDIVLHRLTTKEEMETLTCKYGKDIRLPYFWSTSLIEDYILDEYANKKNKDTLVTLFAPAGTRGIYLDFLSHRFGEQEMLLDKKQIISILWIDQTKNRKIKMHIYAVVSPS